MKMAPVAEVKAKLSEYVKECRYGAIVVTKNGRPAAALVPIDNDDDLERIILSNSKIFRDIVESAEKRIKGKKFVKHNEFWDQVFSKEKSVKSRKK